jgi:hypothetical protein
MGVGSSMGGRMETIKILKFMTICVDPKSKKAPILSGPVPLVDVHGVDQFRRDR